MSLVCAVDEKLLQEMAQMIVQVANPVRVILFGSRARGDAAADSDVDLLIIEKQSFGPGRSRRKEISRIRRCLWDFRVPIDILVFSVEETERWKSSQNHVIARALDEGKVLYEQS